MVDEMTDKIKIIGISKNEHRSEYSFPKNRNSFRVIRDLLIELNFDEEDVYHYFSDLIDSDIYNEETFGFYCEKYSVDIIFFSKRVVLIFNYKEDKQQEIAKIIDKFILEEE